MNTEFELAERGFVAGISPNAIKVVSNWQGVR